MTTWLGFENRSNDVEKNRPDTHRKHELINVMFLVVRALMAGAGQHWRIENSQHYILNVVFGEHLQTDDVASLASCSEYAAL